MIRQQWVIGIDGGGTKTDAILVGRDGTLAAEASGGPSNLQVVGTEQVAHLILHLIQECCEKVSCTADDLYAVAVGLAGAGRPDDRRILHRALSELCREKNFPLTSIIIETDYRIALEAAFASAPGIVLIAGTGSIACARDEAGTVHRVGGWGRIVGDEGSGFVLGREALNAAMRAHDGRGDRTVLLKYAFDHFGVSTIDELLTKLYRDGADIASFVPMLFQAEAERDHVAHTILFRAANELADLVRVPVMRFKPIRKVPVALMGGLLDNENVYSRMVREKIIRTLPQVVIQKPKFPPAFGAVILALQPFKFHS